MSEKIPAIRIQQRGQTAYIVAMNISKLVQLFDEKNALEIDPDLGIQRPLNRSRVAEIKHKLLTWPDLPVPELTAFFGRPHQFRAFSASYPDFGYLIADLVQQLRTIDGQHRLWAMIEAYRECPEKFSQFTVSIRIYVNLSRQELRQMFTDINADQKKPGPNDLIKGDRRNPLSRATVEACQQIPALAGFIRMGSSAPNPGTKLFTLKQMQRATRFMIGDPPAELSETIKAEKVEEAVSGWSAVIDNLPDLGKVQRLEITPRELRNEKVILGVCVWCAIAANVRILREEYPNDWRDCLRALRHIDWRIVVDGHPNPLWASLIRADGKFMWSDEACLLATRRIQTLIQNFTSKGLFHDLEMPARDR